MDLHSVSFLSELNRTKILQLEKIKKMDEIGTSFKYELCEFSMNRTKNSSNPGSLTASKNIL